jgi:hypothetical protein
MDELEFLPHVPCHMCGVTHPFRHCIPYNDLFFCSKECKKKREAEEDNRLKAPR